MKLALTSLILILIYNNLFSQINLANEPEVLVRIINSEKNVGIKLNGDWRVEFNRSKIFLEHGSKLKFQVDKNSLVLIGTNEKKIIKEGGYKFISADSNATIDIYDVPFGVGWWWEGKEDRTYEGEISILLNDENKMEVIVKLPIEEYLKGLVPYEMGGNSPLEALKAQAVAARSEAFAALNSKLYSGPNYDLTSDVECQVFSGNRKRTKSSDLAVKETKGIVLTENDDIINAYYASNCGGHSELIKNV